MMQALMSSYPLFRSQLLFLQDFLTNVPKYRLLENHYDQLFMILEHCHSIVRPHDIGIIVKLITTEPN